MNATVSGHDAYERWMLDRWDRYARKDDCPEEACVQCGATSDGPTTPGCPVCEGVVAGYEEQPLHDTRGGQQ